MTILRRSFRFVTTLLNPKLFSCNNYVNSYLSIVIPGYQLYNSFRNYHSTNVFHKLIPFNLSDIGEGIREVVIKEWYVKPGDSVNEFDAICEVQSDKATVTITSRYDGVVRKLHFEPQDTCLVGQPLVDIEMSGETDSEPPVTAPVTAFPTLPSTTPMHSNYIHDGKVLATPSIRRLAAENELNLSTIVGSGKSGRILKEDILNFLTKEISTSQTQATSTYLPRPLVVSSDGVDRVVSLTAIQKAMKVAMIQSNQIPHFVLSDELDLTRLVELRQQLGQLTVDRHGIKLTYLPFFLKAASLALLDYPTLNSLTDETCDRITYKAAHNIGIAMDTPDGLLVPNIKSIDKLSLVQIASELRRLQDLASVGKLGPTDLDGGTVTLSNIGSIGGTYSAPRILPQQVLIGALGRIQTLPRFAEDGSVCAARILNVSWSADHRIIDGATVTRFCKCWAGYLQNPSTMLMDLK